MGGGGPPTKYFNSVILRVFRLQLSSVMKSATEGSQPFALMRGSIPRSRFKPNCFARAPTILKFLVVQACVSTAKILVRESAPVLPRSPSHASTSGAPRVCVLEIVLTQACRDQTLHNLIAWFTADRPLIDSNRFLIDPNRPLIEQ